MQRVVVRVDRRERGGDDQAVGTEGVVDLGDPGGQEAVDVHDLPALRGQQAADQAVGSGLAPVVGLDAVGAGPHRHLEAVAGRARRKSPRCRKPVWGTSRAFSTRPATSPEGVVVAHRRRAGRSTWASSGGPVGPAVEVLGTTHTRPSRS